MMMTNIPYGRQQINDEDIKAVVDTLQGEYLTQGPKIAEFEEAFASYIGCRFAVAVSNGTAALHLASLAMDVKPGDKVITTPITFAASANCVRYCGGEVVFVDIDPETYLIDLNKLKILLGASPKGTYQGIIPVDFAGRPVNMEEIKELAEEFGLWIIEDACHAPGGFFIDSKEEKQNCGNGAYANLAIFSFHPVKHIACGEGGMITTNDEKLYKKLIQLRTHGITRDQVNFKNDLQFANGQEPEGDAFPGWYMEMQTLGYNYRLTDFQAALGINQLKRNKEGLLRREQIAECYEKAFEGKPFILGQSGKVVGHAYHLYIIEVKNRLGLYNFLRLKKIFAQVHYIPVHLMPYYKELGWKEGDMTDAENYYKHCLSLPMFPSLTDAEQKYVIDCIVEFYK
jgi:UDP-4-amino-4,6-dideoxy-N-acetyl-beta-L-altrosamine transaminase